MSAPVRLRARPDVSPPPVWQPPRALEGISEDGHRLVLVPAPGRHTAAVEWIAAGGAAADPAGDEGAATLAARLDTEGTPDRTALAWRAALEEMGATCWAGVTPAAHRISIDLPTDALEPALSLVAEAAALTSPDSAVLERVRHQALASDRQANTSPQARASRELRALAHDAGNRLRNPLAGSETTLSRLSATAVTQQRVLATAHPLTLVVCADLGLSDLLRAADRVLPRPSAPRRTQPQSTPPAAPAPQQVWVERDDLTQCQVALGAVAVDVTHPDLPVLRLALHAIAGWAGARVDGALREDLGVTYGLRGRVHAHAGDGLLVVAGGVAADAAGTAIAHLRQVFAKVAREGITAAELKAAVAALAGSAAVRLHSPRALVEALSDRIEAGLPADSVGDELARLHAVTLDEVGAAISRWATSDRLSLAVVGPAPARSAAGAVAGGSDHWLVSSPPVRS